jgi:hypothetical protein
MIIVFIEIPMHRPPEIPAIVDLLLAMGKAWDWRTASLAYRRTIR